LFCFGIAATTRSEIKPSGPSSGTTAPRWWPERLCTFVR